MKLIAPAPILSGMKNSLLQQNPHLRNAKSYREALRLNVVSSMAIEGVKKAAEKALPASGKKVAKAA
ncbi:MAG: hypothetical protein ACYC2E_12085 [Sulfuricella sp.]